MITSSGPIGVPFGMNTQSWTYGTVSDCMSACCRAIAVDTDNPVVVLEPWPIRTNRKDRRAAKSIERSLRKRSKRESK